MFYAKSVHLYILMRRETSSCADLFTALFDCLTHPVRRRLLLDLHKTNPPLDLTAETQSPMLYHLHLPKLANPGFIDWDRDDQIIDVGPRFDEIAPILEAIEDCQHHLPHNP